MFIAAYIKKKHQNLRLGAWAILIINHRKVILRYKVLSGFEHTIYKRVPLSVIFASIFFTKQFWVKIRCVAF
jgi:hypothetical protein